MTVAEADGQPRYSEKAGPDLAKRLHFLTFSLLYPAFLGTFIFAIFQHPPDWMFQWPSDWPSPPWAPLFAVYFAFQYMEGVAAPNHYRGPRIAIDFAEIFFMVLLFRQLGFLVSSSQAVLEIDTCATRIFAALVLALPVIARALEADQWTAFNVSLTALSAVAVTSVLASLSYISFMIVLVALLAYVIFFQLLNPWLGDRCKCLQRPLPP